MLASLTNLCELGLFQKMRIWELMSATLGFLYHPNIWIRQGAPCVQRGMLAGMLTSVCVGWKAQQRSSPRQPNIFLQATCGVSSIRP